MPVQVTCWALQKSGVQKLPDLVRTTGVTRTAAVTLLRAQLPVLGTPAITDALYLMAQSYRSQIYGGRCSCSCSTTVCWRTSKRCLVLAAILVAPTCHLLIARPG